MAHEEFTCPICGGNTWRTILKALDFQIDECTGGCIARTSPSPIYSDELPEGARVENLIGEDRRGSGHFRFARSIMDIVGKYQPSGRLLDIGSGCGQLLREASDRGYDTHGIEGSQEVVELAKQAYGVESIVGIFPEVSFEQSSFDVIVLNHVLEHVEDPLLVLKECERILRPGGIQVVMSPNFNSLLRYRAGAQWQGLQPSQHVWQLSKQSVSSLMRKVGLKPIAVQHSCLEYRRESRSIINWMRLRLILSIANPLGLGDNVIVTARKHSNH